VRIKADLTLVDAARRFADAWVLRKDYDAAFRYLSNKSYACYDITRGPEAPQSTSLEDAGRKTRAALERVGQWAATTGRLETIIEAVEPLHASIQIMDQPYSRAFSLTGFPTALADVMECDALARGAVPPDRLPLDYGQAFGMTFPLSHAGGGDAGLAPALAKRGE
jgi:hypothetical protein